MSRKYATRREFAGRIISEFARTGVQRWRAGTLPRSPTDITSSWLSELLGKRVDEVRVSDEDHGTATRARLIVNGEQLPTTAFVKTTPSRPIERLFNNVYGLGETEATFYQTVAAELADCVPAVYGARWDARDGRSIVIIEDLAVRSIRFADASDPCTADEAAIMARTLAGVHRKYWQSSRFATDLRRFSTVNSPSQWFGPYSSYLMTRVPQRYWDLVDAGFRRDALILHNHRNEIAALWGSLPQALLHGDDHRGNLGFHDDGVTLFDWQMAGQGPALKDLAYFATSSLEPDVRRSIERDLVREYVDRVNGAGGPGLTESAAWEQYRLLVVTAYLATAVTVVFAGRLQSDTAMRTVLERSVAAVRDHESFDRLRRRLN